MRLLLLLALILLPCSPLLAREAGVWLAEGKARLSIETDGHVSAVELDESFGREIDARLRERIAEWRFRPVLIDGRAVPVSAHAQLRLRAVFDGSKQGEVSIIAAQFVDPPEALADHPSRGWTAPGYPRRAIQSGHGAMVTMKVEVDEQGRVLNVGGESSWLTGPATSERHARDLMQRFVLASRKAVQRWQMPTPAETGSRFYTIPIHFRTGQARSPWLPVQWVQLQPEPWMLAADAAQVATLDTAGQAGRRDLHLLTELDREG
jgi:hypothetical protein